MVDAYIVFFYLVGMVFIGAFYGKNLKSLDEYLISRREFSDKAMLATLFATVIGAGSTCGIVSNVYAHGIIFLFAFYGAALNKFLVAKFVVPKMKKMDEGTSIGDIFEQDYGVCGRVTIGISILFVSLVTLGQQIFAIGLIFEYFFKTYFFVGVIFGFGTLVLYSAFGGIRAVVKTDIVQFILIFSLIPVVFLVIMNQIDLPNDNVYDRIFPPINIDIGMKALMMFFVMTFTALDPSFIHRIILSRDKEQAVYITKMTGYLSIFLFTAMGFLGVFAGLIEGNFDEKQALPFILDNYVPPFLKGIAISALLATIMSTADSNLHVVSCSVVKDLILPFKEHIKPRKQLQLARISTFSIGICAVIVCVWYKNIFDIMLFAFGLWAPTGLIPFVFLLFGKKTSEKHLVLGCVTSLIVTVSWNFFLKSTFYVDGLLPGSLYSILYFFYASKHNAGLINDEKR